MATDSQGRRPAPPRRTRPARDENWSTGTGAWWRHKMLWYVVLVPVLLGGQLMAMGDVVPGAIVLAVVGLTAGWIVIARKRSAQKRAQVEASRWQRRMRRGS